MIWDFTCPDTLAASHLNRAVVGPGAVANEAERRKSSKYRSLAAHYAFTPVAVETLGALGDEASVFFRDLGHRIAAVTSEPKSFQFLMQRLSVTVQRGNAACVLGTAPASLRLDELLIYSWQSSSALHCFFRFVNCLHYFLKIYYGINNVRACSFNGQTIDKVLFLFYQFLF